MQPGGKSGEEGSFGEEVPIPPTIISQVRIWHSKMIKVALVDFLWEFTLESSGREAAPPLQSGWESGRLQQQGEQMHGAFARPITRGQLQ